MSRDSKPENGLREDFVLASSGWVGVEANTPRQISVSLTSSLKDSCHIVIATRLAANSMPVYADACWLNFYLDFVARSLPEVSDTGFHKERGLVLN